MQDGGGPLAAVAVTLMLYAVAAVDIRIWPVAVLAPLPILAVAPELDDRTAAQFAFAAYFLGNMAGWLAETFASALWMLALAHGAGAAIFAAIVVLHAEAVRRWTPWLAALVFPVLFAALWFGVSLMSPHGTWGNPAYSMVGFLPLMQIAAWTGLAGVVFLMSAVPAAIAVAWYRERWNMESRPVAIAAIAVFAFVSLVGGIRMLISPGAGKVRIGLAATDQKIEAFKSGDPEDAAAVMALYAPMVARLAAEHVQIAVLPEKIAAVTPKYESSLEAGFASIARLNNLWLAVGLNRIDPNPMRNFALVFSPAGEVAAVYAKRHLIPGLESGYEPGHRLATFNPPWGKTAVAICKDLDFPALGREIANSGALLVVAPAWDWPGSEMIHERMAAVRAIESGFSIARSAREGYVSLVDSRGREIASRSTRVADPAVLAADLPLGCGATYYARHGEWFGKFIVILAVFLIALLGLSIRMRKPIAGSAVPPGLRPGAEPIAVQIHNPDSGAE